MTNRFGFVDLFSTLVGLWKKHLHFKLTSFLVGSKICAMGHFPRFHQAVFFHGNHRGPTLRSIILTHTFYGNHQVRTFRTNGWGFLGLGLVGGSLWVDRWFGFGCLVWFWLFGHCKRLVVWLFVVINCLLVCLLVVNSKDFSWFSVQSWCSHRSQYSR